MCSQSVGICLRKEATHENPYHDNTRVAETSINQSDFLKTVVQLDIQKALDIQFTELIVALPYERTTERRAVHKWVC